MTTIKNISRRTFVRSIGLASGGLILGCHTSVFKNNDITSQNNEFTPNLFIQLNSDGSLILVASRSEMGNGVRTSLTSIIADEMEADWSKVTVKQATGDAKYGDQNTDGSRSVRTLYKTMRNLGATAKAMLITAAAKYWEVSESTCSAKNHFIYHQSGKKIGYGNLVEIAKTLEVPKNSTLKNSDKFKYIGSELKSIDVEDFVTGKAVFGLDKRIPNMKFAAIARCPVTFGTVKSFEENKAKEINGVENIIEIPRVKKPFGALGGVAVIANNSWSAFQGKKALKIEWNFGENADYSSENYMQQITKNVHKSGKVGKDVGNVDKAFSKANKIIESTFQLPHLSHAPMEVPNSVAVVKSNSCEVWSPTQAPQRTRKDIADYLNIPEENVTVHVTFLGGGFGRKSKPDYTLEAVILSQKTNSPIQVVWTREDDIQHDYYHTVSAQYLKASLDKNGKVTGWLHRFALPSIVSTFTPGVDYAAGFEIASAANVPFEVENMRVEVGKAPAKVRIGWLRSVINIPHGFSENVFADELAIAANQDPLVFRLKLIGSNRIEETQNPIKYNTARLKNVLIKAAKNANWGEKLPKNYGMGLAVHYSFYSYVASVVKVSVINGKLKIHKINSVIDCGTAVNKNTIRSQMEGAAIFGMSLAFYGKITAKNGAIEQNNFDDYKMVRMHEIPEIDVEIIESKEKPTGVGEPGVPVIAPAIVNAIFQATGKRYHNLPLSDYGLV